MTKIESAQAAYRAASRAYHQEWAHGDSPALIAAEARRDAAWVALCDAGRRAPFRYEDGDRAAHAQRQQLALDDA